MPNKRTLILLAVSAFLLLAPAAASAAPVTNTNDAGAGSLRQAVIDAAPGATIVVPAGTYTLTSGELLIDKGLTLAGAGTATTIVRSGGAFRVIHVKAAAGAEVAISGLTIRDGLMMNPGVALGGGIWVEGANLTLDRVLVANNVARGGISAGGGVGVRSAGATMTVRDSVFTGNAANASAAEAGKPGTISEGGGLYSRESGAVTIERSTFTNNQALSRGGQGPADPKQSGSISHGGGIYIEGNAASLISASTVSGNTADGSPGPGGTPGPARGGGLFLAGENGGTIRVNGLTVAGNSAVGSGSGGGVRASAAVGGQVTIVASTMVANSAVGATAVGGNLAFGARVSVASSVLSGGAGAASTENCDGAGNSLGFNLEDRDQCGFKASGDRVNTNPQIGPLQDNGGPTATMLPAETSPLLDQGSAFGSTTDQRGLPRPVDFASRANPSAPSADGTDIGAAELQPAATFAIGKLTKNKKKGTALLTVALPALNLGTLTLSGKGLKTKTVAVNGATQMTIAVATQGKATKGLLRRGQRKVRINLTYAPTTALSANLSRPATLVRKLKHHRRGR